MLTPATIKRIATALNKSINLPIIPEATEQIVFEKSVELIFSRYQDDSVLIKALLAIGEGLTPETKEYYRNQMIGSITVAIAILSPFRLSDSLITAGVTRAVDLILAYVDTQPLTTLEGLDDLRESPDIAALISNPDSSNGQV